MKAATKKTVGTALKILALLFVYDRVAAPAAAKVESKLKGGA